MLLEVFLCNTTSKIRWLVAQCSCAVRRLAERISADVNAALIIEHIDQQWMWPLGMSVDWIDVVRTVYVREAYTKRGCVTSVWHHCFHLMHICWLSDTLATFTMCASGNIDVIAHAIKNTARAASLNRLTSIDLADLTDIPAALVTRGGNVGEFIELAFDVVMILLGIYDKKFAVAACEKMIFAAYLCADVSLDSTSDKSDNLGDSVASCISGIWPCNANKSPNIVKMRCAALCQRCVSAVISV